VTAISLEVTIGWCLVIMATGYTIHLTISDLTNNQNEMYSTTYMIYHCSSIVLELLEAQYFQLAITVASFIYP